MGPVPVTTIVLLLKCHTNLQSFQAVSKLTNQMMPVYYYGNRRSSGQGKGMKLGRKGKDVDSFVDQIRAEGGKG